MKNIHPQVFDLVIDEIENFKTFAEALVDEDASGDYVIKILIIYLRIKFGQ